MARSTSSAKRRRVAVLAIRLALLPIACAFSLVATAQTANLDSLRAVWRDAARPDSVRYSACYDLCEAIAYNHPDSALRYANALIAFTRERNMDRAHRSAQTLRANALYHLGRNQEALAGYERVLQLSTEAKDTAQAAAALGNRGSLYLGMGRTDEALRDLEQAHLLMKESGHADVAASILNNLAVISEMVGRYIKAAEYYDRAIREFDALKDEHSAARVMSNLGIVYRQLGDEAKAEAIYLKAIDRLEAQGDKAWQSTTLTNLGSLYHDAGRKAEAKHAWQEALSLMDEREGARAFSQLLVNLGAVQQDEGQLDSAKHLFDRALSIALEKHDDQQAGTAKQALAEWWALKGDHAKAIAIGEEALALGRSTADLDLTEKVLDLLRREYGSTESYVKAHAYATELIALRDSTRTAEEQRAVLRFEYQYENDKRALSDSLQFAAASAVKNKEIQKQKVIRNGFVGGFALVALFAVVFFTQRNRISKEKARSEELLLNILPEEVAEELKAKGEADAVQIDQVSVLFTDFKGFTAMSEKLSPKALVKDLHECFSAFDRICEKHGIEKIKTIGDAYMAAGGLPTPNATHATDATLAALEMRDFIAEGKARKIAAGLPYFEIRIGVHSGPVVAGIVGVKKFQYDIWGDTVNTASRMESSGEPGKVNISGATHELVREVMEVVDVKEGEGADNPPAVTRQQATRPAFDFTPRGKVQAKGKGELEMFFVERRTMERA